MTPAIPTPEEYAAIEAKATPWAEIEERLKADESPENIEAIEALIEAERPYLGAWDVGLIIRRILTGEMGDVVAAAPG